MLLRLFGTPAAGPRYRQLPRGGGLQHLHKVCPGRGVFHGALFLGDEVAVGPVRLRLLELPAREEALVAVIKLGGQHGSAPPVEHRVVEAEGELEALLRAAEDVHVKERAVLPVKDVAPAPVEPAREVLLLLFVGPAAQVLHL